MLKDEFSRHTVAFLTIALAAILLYPVTLAGFTLIIWLLLGLVVLVTIMTLVTK